jgi:hypothetical protein
VEQGNVTCFLQQMHDVLKGGLVPLIVARSDPWRSIHQVSGKDGLGSIDHEKGHEACRSTQGRSQTPEDRREFRDPSTAKLIQPIEDPWLEALQDHAFGVLGLSIVDGG